MHTISRHNSRRLLQDQHTICFNKQHRYYKTTAKTVKYSNKQLRYFKTTAKAAKVSSERAFSHAGPAAWNVPSRMLVQQLERTTKRQTNCVLKPVYQSSEDDLTLEHRGCKNCSPLVFLEYLSCPSVFSIAYS